MRAPKSLGNSQYSVEVFDMHSRSTTYHVRMYKLTVCLQMLFLSHLLRYAYSLGWTLKYWLAGSNCHELRMASAPCEALSNVVEFSKSFRPALMVLIGSKAEKADWMGRRFAYMRSNMTVSKTSRTKSMVAVVVVCYAVSVNRWCRIGEAIEQGGSLKLSVRQAGVVCEEA